MSDKLSSLREFLVRLSNLKAQITQVGSRNDKYHSDLDAFYKAACIIANDGLGLFALLACQHIAEVVPSRVNQENTKYFKVFNKYHANPIILRKHIDALLSDGVLADFDAIVKSDVTEREILAFRLGCP